MDFSIKKNIRLTERVNMDFGAVFTNIFNHNQLFDPYLILGDTADWGALTGEVNTPRKIELGLARPLLNDCRGSSRTAHKQRLQKNGEGLTALSVSFVGAGIPRRSRVALRRDDRHPLRLVLILWSAKCRYEPRTQSRKRVLV